MLTGPHAALTEQQASVEPRSPERGNLTAHTRRAKLGVPRPLPACMLLRGKLPDFLVVPVLVLPDDLRPMLETIGNQSFV